GSVLYRYEDARDAMRFYHQFASNAPDELSADAALMTSDAGERFFSISACYAGSIADGERVIAPPRAHGAPVDQNFAAIPYLQIQAASDSLFPRGRRYYWKAQFLREITDEAIDTLLAAYANHRFPGMFIFQQVGGAIGRVPKTDTPYVSRDALYD